MNQNANFGASLSSGTGTTTFFSNTDGSNTCVILNPPTLYIRGFGLTPNVGSTRYAYSWVGANATATTNQQQLSGFSVASQSVSNVWTCAITDTRTAQVVAPLPSYNQTYTAPSAIITFTRNVTGSGPLQQERYNCTATVYNTTPTSYTWTYLVSNTGSSFASGTTSSTATTQYEVIIDVSGTIDVVQCTVGYAGGTITVTRQLRWA